MATQVLAEVETEAGPSIPFPIFSERTRNSAVQTTHELQILGNQSLSAAPYRTYEASLQTQPDALPPHEDAPTTTVLTKGRAIVVIAQLLGLQLFSSFCGGAVVVGQPAIAATLGLSNNILVWPTSAFYLTAGSCLLLAGSIADIVGVRRVNLVGSFLLATSALACGLARSGSELIAFRALQGISYAIVTPSSVSIISTTIEDGRPRNLGFACLGLAAPLGFSLGLVLSGIMINSVGWRPAFYLAAGASALLFLVGVWAIPSGIAARHERSTWKRLATELDWIGTLVASAGLAMMSYVLAALSSDIDSIRHASNIALLVFSIACLPIFVAWMNYQVRNDRPALIPNSLWKSSVFTTICAMVTLTTAVTNCMELYSSLFFQEVQQQSALGASLRILPSLVAGVLTNLVTGIFVSRMPILWSVLISSMLCATAQLLMALINPDWPYWYDAFFAQTLTPVSSDILFTVGLLIVSAEFPPNTQALGGAVFNTCAQLGTSIGLTVTSVIATSRTKASPHVDKTSPAALMFGYRAVFWTLFAWIGLGCLLCLFLRKASKVGVKRE